jgi:5-methylcytosine-specific restriction endonuclease McrBC regulatory subunit McrC
LGQSGVRKLELSIDLLHYYPDKKVIYTISDLANIYGKSKKVIRLILAKSNIPTYGKRKIFVLLFDLAELFRKDLYKE